MRGYAVFIVFLLTLSFVTAVSGPFQENGREYYVVSADDASEDTGDEVCQKLGKTCVGYTATTTSVCQQVHPSAAVSSSLSGDRTGVYCDGAPQSGVCADKTNTCHICPRCIVGVDCSTPIGGLYREMYVECSGSQQCQVTMHARDTQAFLREVPLLNRQLQGCPAPLPSVVGSIIGGNTRVDIQMQDGSTKNIFVTIANKQITGLSTAGSCKHKVTVSEQDLNAVLGSHDRAAAMSHMFKTKKLVVGGCTFLRSTLSFFTQPIIRFFTPSPPAPPQQTVATYNGYRVCDFYQHNKKHVTCSAFRAADTFCVLTFGSIHAKALKCEEQGQVICGLPCNAPGLTPTRCPFDSDRARGNQAAPLDFCQAAPAPTGNQPTVAGPRGKPANCDDTWLPGHRAYAQNQATWDSYSSDTDAVCQSQPGRGLPAGCVHTVQLSISGNPYYLCWYRR
ncbi:MAG: hypothetical protein OXR66_01355 [Candidatus Woesearchaeota archaeon]|nr:hypothetical protein [Candidatus Woesearchaeota archaeon]